MPFRNFLRDGLRHHLPQIPGRTELLRMRGVPKDQRMKFLGLLLFCNFKRRQCWRPGRDESPAATSQVASMLRAHGEFISTHATLSRWDKVWSTGVSEDAIQKVVQFLVSARTYSRLERAFFAASDPGIQKALGGIVDSLRDTYRIWHSTLTGTGQIPRWAEEVAAQICDYRKN